MRDNAGRSESEDRYEPDEMRGGGDGGLQPLGASPPPTRAPVGPPRQTMMGNIRRLSTMAFRRAPATPKSQGGGGGEGGEAAETATAARKVNPIFNNCDANRDGVLSRSEFTNAMQMVMYSQKEAKMFNELTDVDIDKEFLIAGGLDAIQQGQLFLDEGEITEPMFVEWMPTFKATTLTRRRLLRDLGISTVQQSVALEASVDADGQKVSAIAAVAAYCHELTSLSVRGEVSAEALAPLADSATLQRLDLSYTDVDAAGLRAIAYCPALADLVLAGCVSVGDSGVSAIAEGGFGALKQITISLNAATVSLETLDKLDCFILYDESVPAPPTTDTAAGPGGGEAAAAPPPTQADDASSAGEATAQAATSTAAGDTNLFATAAPEAPLAEGSPTHGPTTVSAKKGGAGCVIS